MLDELKRQLEEAAEAFTEDAQALSTLLTTMANDVQRALAEPLEIFPVAHHSPASALQMVRRLGQRAPKVIYIELCEDMRGIVPNLAYCRLPVALQAFAAKSEIIPDERLPVSVVAPITEASAEYQAMAYCLQHPETELVFVDRAVDYVFQWQKTDISTPEEDSDDMPEEEATLHSTAIGVSTGELEPTFEEFLHFLLKNSNTRNYAEWWDQYVERSIIAADLDTYRQVMVLIGSLIRHLGREAEDLTVDELRERYMWTRIKQHMSANNIAPSEAIYICGAAHAASAVPEFGTHTDAVWDDLPPLSNTQWLFGVIPSSFAAIEYQFSHPVGTVSMAESTWQKSMKAAALNSFRLAMDGKPAKKQKKSAPASNPPAPTEGRLAKTDVLFSFLTQAPQFVSADIEQLIDWCTRIVELARSNGYLASTADAIAIYETAMLLANIRNRTHPSAYDFIDAAITCLEKDRTPKKRTVAQLCRILLGGDRVGTVGYESLPPLAQNIYDRLAPMGVNLFAKTNQRALMDYTKSPHLLDCSELLWRLNYLLGNAVVQPIMGERKLGHVPIQESWEIRIGKAQGQVIQLGYEGVTLEQVLEQRMRQRAFDPNATAALALHTAEASLLYLSSSRVTEEFGQHATHLLSQETSAAQAQDIFRRARHLVHHYRATPNGLPQWLEAFVSTGYTHYGSLLPQAMTDRGTSAEDIAGMLGFIFTLEGLALSVGCSREQIVISVQQAAQEDIPPDKLGLQWVAEWLLGLRTIASIREFLHAIIENPMRLPTLPDYLNGFIMALLFAPQISVFVVEVLSNIFANVPDATLLPWLPSLMLKLRDHQSSLQPLLKEASSIFPNSLSGFATWQPEWLQDVADDPIEDENAPLDADIATIRALLSTAPETLNRLAQFTGGQ